MFLIQQTLRKWASSIPQELPRPYLFLVRIRIWLTVRDPWGVFDFAIVTSALMPASGQFSVLRALRIVSGVPRLRRVVGALLGAVPGIGAVAAC